jgi:ornithine carbamoyltransferase
VSVLDFEPEELEQCLLLAARLKRERPLGPDAPTASALGGAHFALLFDKPSLRTRSTFEIAVRELGGHVTAPMPEVALGPREPIADVARNLERWVRGAIIRTHAHADVVEFARAARHLHVINALSDREHPCQALADFQTLREQWDGRLTGRTMAFIGDGNNVATSLAHAAAMLGVNLRVASPAGYELPSDVVDACRRVARHGAELQLLRDPREAVRNADAVYTDVWTSMGQEAEMERREAAFAGYQVTPELMRAAGPGAVFLHCLPAHRDQEVSSVVFESRSSLVFEQAENRLHSQKALILTLMASSTGR